LIVRITTYRKERRCEPSKVYWHGCSSGNDLGCGHGFLRQADSESILETKAATILQFIGGLRGSLLVTFEEGTSAAWLYDLLKPHVANVLVCDPRKNALLKDGSKSDRIDARKLAELLRGNHLSPIYHGEKAYAL
jgi:hypothetical protein